MCIHICKFTNAMLAYLVNATKGLLCAYRMPLQFLYFAIQLSNMDDMELERLEKSVLAEIRQRQRCAVLRFPVCSGQRHSYSV
jgi:hypothetical protein